MGLAYAAAAWRTRSLWPAVGLHWGGNLGPLLLGHAVNVTVQSVDRDRLIYVVLNLLVACAFLVIRPRRRPTTRHEAQLRLARKT